LGEQALPLLCFYSRLNEMTRSFPASFEGKKKSPMQWVCEHLQSFFFLIGWHELIAKYSLLLQFNLSFFICFIKRYLNYVFADPKGFVDSMAR